MIVKIVIADNLEHLSNMIDVVITVEDNGIGMSSSDIKNLFKPYFRSEDNLELNYGGHGLGLHISHSIAKRIGGDLTVNS